MDHIWHSSPVRNTQEGTANFSDKQIGYLKRIAKGDSSCCAELKKGKNGVYSLEVREVSWLASKFGAKERTLKTEDAIAQFVRDNGNLLKNDTEFQGYLTKTSAQCSRKIDFENSLNKLKEAKEKPADYSVKLEYKEGGSRYELVVKKLSSFTSCITQVVRFLSGRSGELSKDSQAAIKKFTLDNLDFATTAAKTNAVCYRMLTDVVAGCKGDQLKQAPAGYEKEIADLKKIKEEAEPLMKFEGEKKLLFLDPVEESNKGKPLSAQAKMAEKKAIAKLEKAVDEEQDGEAAYLLALYAARGVDNRSRCSVSTFKREIDSVLGRIEEGLLKLPAGSLVREACEACRNDKKFNSPSLNSTFPLDPTEKQQVRVTGFKDVITNVIVVK